MKTTTLPKTMNGQLTEDNRVSLEELIRRCPDTEASIAAEQVLSFDDQVDYTTIQLNAAAAEVLRDALIRGLATNSPPTTRVNPHIVTNNVQKRG